MAPQKNFMFIDQIRRDSGKNVSGKKAINGRNRNGHGFGKTEKARPSVTARLLGVVSKKEGIERKRDARNFRTSETGVREKKEISSRQGRKRGPASGGSRTAKRSSRSRRDPGRVMSIGNGQGKQTVPTIGKETLRIIPLGGQEEVGRNMTAFEYGDDIVIVDMGMQFAEEDMHGIDYIVPNISYLRGKEKNIRGVIFTHGHLDHIGAAPILLEQLGYPPIVGRDLTIAMIKHKVEDHKKGASSRLKTIHVKTFHDTVRLGVFQAGFFDVEHSIMDAIGIVLATPRGTVLHLGDWTIGHDPVDERVIGYEHLSRLPRPTILMLESLGAINQKEPKSEKEVQKNLEDLISGAPGRVIIGTFSSQIKRVGYLAQYAESIGKKVALDGYSMKMNIEIAKELGYLKVRKETFIPIADAHKYPDNRVVVICTGAQGETNAALSKIVTDAHRFIRLQRNDTIVFSSSVIPGNERSIQRLKDSLYRKCDNVIHSDIMDIHMSGHATASDMQEIIRQIKPDYFLPVYANHYFLKEAGKRAEEIGFPKDKIFVLDNGGVMEFTRDGAHVRKEKADTSYVFIDGLGIGDIGSVVLRDRQMLAADGMFVITALVHSKKKTVESVQITSRGFIYVKENFELVNDAKKKAKQILEEAFRNEEKPDWRIIEGKIRDVIGKFLFQKTERMPMILPVIMEGK